MSEITPFVRYISSSRRVSCTYFLKAKVVCHESFYLHFFHDLCASYRGVRLCGVHHTAESDSAVCIIPQSYENKASAKTLRCASHCGVGLRGVHHTAESSSAVCIIPQSQALRCASHRGVKMYTAESKSKSLGVSGCF